MKTNCPNCGAPIESGKCPYCGTILYDFAALSDTDPVYLRIKVRNNILALKVLMTDLSIEMCPDDVNITANFVALPDDKTDYSY